MLGSSAQPGVIPRAVGEVFNLVNAQDEDEAWDYSIGMSYLEIYNEKVWVVFYRFPPLNLPLLRVMRSRSTHVF